MQIVSTARYDKKEEKFFAKHKELLDRYALMLKQLQEDHNAAWLKLHRLKWKLSEFHAVSLTYEHRIVIFFRIVENEIVLVNIGTHDEVYRDG